VRPVAARDEQEVAERGAGDVVSGPAGERDDLAHAVALLAPD
jgi:hypothetical protein